MFISSATVTPEYSALIRTFNSERTLPATLACLQRQTNPPRQYIFVDSGSTDQTLACLPPGSRMHRFEGDKFNYSEALNQGLRLVTTEHVLIISSHTELGNPGAVSHALELLNSNPHIGAAYFCEVNTGSLQHELIDRRNFDGFNGLWNTCAVVRVPLLRKRMFRPEVFASEDQEWAAWLFNVERMSIARISGGGLVLRNPRMNSSRKKIDAYVAVACFAYPDLLKWSNICRLLRYALRPRNEFEQANRKLHLLLALHLTVSRYIKPRRKSRYF